MQIRPFLTFAVLAGLVAAPLSIAERSSAAPTAEPNYGLIWTVDPTTNSLNAYAADANGTSTPVITINGGSTKLHVPTGVAVDTSGKLYVTNSGNDSITEYAADATGNVAPIATISGSLTGLDSPSSIALAHGEIWVTDPNSNVVEAFSVGSNGNLLPAESISGAKTKLNHPVAIAVSTGPEDLFLGTSIDVINRPTAGAASVESFQTGRGNVKPAAYLSGDKHLTAPSAILSAEFGELWIADSAANSVSRYFAEPSFPGFPGGGSIEREDTIRGAKTGLNSPDGLSHDAFGRLVVSNAGDHTVRFFAPKARGNATPVRTVNGVETGVGAPAAAQIFGAAPSAPLNVKVKLHGTHAHLSWKAPEVTGGGVVGYDVERFRVTSNGGSISGGGSVSGFGIGVTTKQTHLVDTIKPGARYEFIVSAVNAFGETAAHSVHAAILTKPTTPRKVRTFTVKHGMAVLWQAPAVDGGGALRYRVSYAAGCAPGSKGCDAKHVTVHGFQTDVKVQGLKAHTTYYVSVTAANKKGASAPSKPVKATTK